MLRTHLLEQWSMAEPGRGRGLAHLNSNDYDVARTVMALLPVPTTTMKAVVEAASGRDPLARLAPCMSSGSL